MKYLYVRTLLSCTIVMNKAINMNSILSKSTIFLTLLTVLIIGRSLPLESQNLPLHQIQLKDIKGSRTTLQNILPKDKNIIISYWATWCGPCKKELDVFKNLYPDLTESYDVEILAISTDDARSAGKVRSTVHQRKWPFVIYTDVEGSSKQVFNFETIPFTVLLDKEGNIAYSHIGYAHGDEEKLIDVLKSLP